MAERTTKVKLTAEVQGYVDGMTQAAKATRETGSAAEKLGLQTESMEKMSRTMLLAGGTMAAGLMLTAKAAIDWDSAWAGVTKTVDGTPEQLAEVEAGLRGLASVLPASHTEIAAVAEAAGQLGIKTPEVVKFTKTMIDLGETTNLSAEQAATSLARFMTVMGTTKGDVDRLGSALVELGNNYATTEAEILAMSMRLSGAGAQIGLSEGQVLGLSTALSSVGIEAEAGGSAMSKVMIDIASSVDKGGERLDLFAKVSGQSASAFAAQWKSDPGAALSSFVNGLANAEAQGTSTFAIFEELGFAEARMRDALLRSAQAAGEFSSAMATGNKATRENTALTEEAEKRYETTAAKLGIMRNKFVDASITVGNEFLPAIEGVAEGLGGFADMLAGMDGPLANMVAWGGVVAAGILLTGGVALGAIPKIAAYKVALETLGVSTAGLSKGVKGLGSFIMGPWGLALAAGALGAHLFGKALDASKASSDDLSNSLKQGVGAYKSMVDATDGEWKLFVDVESQIKDLPGLLDKAATSGRGLLSSMSFNENAALDSIKEFGTVLAQLSTTDLPRSQAAFASWAKDANLNDAQMLTALNEEMPQFKSALIDAAEAAGIATDDATLLKFALGELNPVSDDSSRAAKNAADAYVAQANAAQAAADELLGLMDAIMAVNDVGQTAESTNARYQQTLADVAEAVKNAQEGLDGYSTSMDANTVEGSKNREMFAGLAADSQRAAYATMEQETATLGAEQAAKNYASTLASGRAELVDQITALTGNRDAAEAFADAVYKIPTEHELLLISNAASESEKVAAYQAILDAVSEEELTKLIIDRGDSEAKLDAHLRALNSIPGYKETVINTVMQETGAPRGQVGAAYDNANGAIYDNKVKSFAAGGFEPGIYGYQPGGIHKFAEEFSEAYISLDPARRTRSMGVWQETGERMGAFAGIASTVAAAVAAAMGNGGSSSVTNNNLTVVNPVVRDGFQDAWDNVDERGMF